jgi:hypothetical protein
MGRGVIRNLRGQKFGKLRVLKFAEVRKNAAYWLCKCDCGKTNIVAGFALTSGNTKTCGCGKYGNYVTHGQTRNRTVTPEWVAFNNARSRCQRKSHPRYADWGGRGIEFRFDSFEEFYVELGPKPSPKHSVDRIDNEGHYEKGNVRWATPIEQRNNRRDRCLSIA